MSKPKPHNKESLNKNALTTRSKKDKRRFLSHIYGSKKWKTLRSEYISEHPICEECKEKQATQVHHIKKFSDGKSKREIEKLAYNKKNLMALCEECHKKKHKKQPTT